MLLNLMCLDLHFVWCDGVYSPVACLHSTEKQQLLAVGDNSGTLHILEIPWSLRQPTPGEVSHRAHCCNPLVVVAVTLLTAVTFSCCC